MTSREQEKGWVGTPARPRHRDLNPARFLWEQQGCCNTWDAQNPPHNGANKGISLGAQRYFTLDFRVQDPGAEPPYLCGHISGQTACMKGVLEINNTTNVFLELEGNQIFQAGNSPCCQHTLGKYSHLHFPPSLMSCSIPPNLFPSLFPLFYSLCCLTLSSAASGLQSEIFFPLKKSKWLS